MEKFVVLESDLGERVDVFLSKKLNQSRAFVQKLILSNSVFFNKTVLSKFSQKVKPFDEYLVFLEEKRETDIIPQRIPLDIVFEDDDIIVLNKQASMVVHPACGNYEGTIVNALLHHFDNLSRVNGSLRPGIVHRLDKDTTGLMVVAKNDNSHNRLSVQFDHKNKTIFREYIAIVHGVLNKKQGTIEEPIARSKVNRQKMRVSKIGRYAKTEFELQETFNKVASKVKCNLSTGRTHQIRVHLSHIGHPVIGDCLYSRTNSSSIIKRQALHAFKLSFNHPTKNCQMEFEIKLPKDMEDLIEELSK